MAYEIGVKSSFWPKQFLPITKYDILNLVFTDSGCFKFWRLHKLIGQSATNGKGLVRLVFISKTVYYGGIIEFAELREVPEHLVQPYYSSLIS